MASDIPSFAVSVYLVRRTPESSQAVLHYVLLLILGPRTVRACAQLTRGPEPSLVCGVRGADCGQGTVVIRHGASTHGEKSGPGTAASVLRHETRGAVTQSDGADRVTCAEHSTGTRATCG